MRHGEAGAQRAARGVKRSEARRQATGDGGNRAKQGGGSARSKGRRGRSGARLGVY